MAPERDFESAFGQLASVELGQKVPTLMPFLVGFQLVRKTNNDAHAMGVFTFVVGKQTYYVPVNWMSGQVKGMNSVLIVKQNLFVPLTEAWVNKVTSKRPAVTGGGTDVDPGQAGAGRPNLDFFRRFAVKTASVDGGPFTGLVKTAHGEEDLGWAKLVDSVSYDLDLVDQLEASPVLAKRAADLLASNEKLAAAMFSYYEADSTVSRLCDAAGYAKEKQASVSAMKRMPPIVAYLSDVSGTQTISEKDREALMRGEPLLINGGKSAIVDPKRVELSGPLEGGNVGQVLLEDGGLKPMIVMKSQINLEGATQNVPLVIDLESGAATAANPDTLFMVTGRPRAWADLYKALPEKLGTVDKDDVFVLVTEDGVSTMPLRLCAKCTDSAGDFWIVASHSVFTADGIRDWDRGRSEDITDPDTRDSYWGIRLKFNESGENFCRVGTTMFVRDDRTKALVIGAAGSGSCRIPSVPVGGHKAVDWFFGSANVKKASVSASEAHTPSCYRRLCEQYELPLATAKEAMDRAKAEGSYEFLVKYAISFPSMDRTYDSLFGVASQRPVQEEQLYEERSPQQNIQSPILDDRLFNNQAVQKALEAHSAGTKEVFDVSLLNSIMNQNDIGDEVQKAVPAMLKGNDQVGRILQRLYWRYSEFADKYGADALNELEDLLTSSFRNTGDMILFLQKSTLEPDDVADEAVVQL